MSEGWAKFEAKHVIKLNKLLLRSAVVSRKNGKHINDKVENGMILHIWFVYQEKYKHHFVRNLNIAECV